MRPFLFSSLQLHPQSDSVRAVFSSSVSGGILLMLFNLHFWFTLSMFLDLISRIFLEEKCIDLSVLHRLFYKQDPKEKKNYKKVQSSCSSSSKPSEIRSSLPPKPLPLGLLESLENELCPRLVLSLVTKLLNSSSFLATVSLSGLVICKV